MLVVELRPLVLYGVTGKGFSDQMTFTQRCEGNEKVSHLWEEHFRKKESTCKCPEAWSVSSRGRSGDQVFRVCLALHIHTIYTTDLC